MNVIRKFNFEDKVCHAYSECPIELIILFQFGWLVGDNISVNDVAAQYVCKELKPRARKLDAKEIHGRYVIKLYHDNLILINKTKKMYRAHRESTL